MLAFDGGQKTESLYNITGTERMRTNLRGLKKARSELQEVESMKMKMNSLRIIAAGIILVLFTGNNGIIYTWAASDTKSAASAEDRAKGEDEVVAYGGHTYALFDEGVSWDNAKKSCEKRGGHLVCINDEKEQQFLQTLVAGGGLPFYWIGLSDAEIEGTFKWVNGDPLTYTNWCQDQPDNWQGSEDSVMMPNRDVQFSKYDEWTNPFGTWNDMNSNGDRDHSLSEMGYICEWDSVDKKRNQTIKLTLDELEKALRDEDIEAVIDWENGTVTLDNGILFDTDSYTVKAKGCEVIDSFMNALDYVLQDEKIKSDISSINIQGHTDSSGSYAHNVELSIKRAEAVRSECIKCVSDDAAAAEYYRDLFKVTGCASDFPVLDKKGAEDKSLSRRVVFVFFLK